MWLAIAVSAYFINAGVYVADKFLLSKKVHSSISYAFFVGVWSIFNIALLPLDWWVPSGRELAIDLLAGGLFLATLVFWYKALHQSEATRVVPVVGALVPIFSFVFSYIFLDEVMTTAQMLSVFVLIAGGILISVKQTRFFYLRQLWNRFLNIFGSLLGAFAADLQPTRRLLFNSTVSALFFAAYYVLIKHIYNTQPFVGAFVWSRLGSFLGALLILLLPAWRTLIFEQKKENSRPTSLFFFLSVRFMAAMAFILLNYSIKLAPNVALVNALQGVQYAFLLVIVFLLSSRYPRYLKEEIGQGVLLQKSIGIALVALAMYMLVI